MTDRDHPSRQHDALAAAVSRIDEITEPGRRLSPAAYTRAALDAVWLAYHAGRAAAVSELRTTQQVADELGIDSSLVRRYVRQHGIGWNVGRDWLLRPEDVEAVRARNTTRGRAQRDG